MGSEKNARLGENPGQWLWPEYYQAFPAFSAETVRVGCHPRKMLHPSAAKQAIVLLHGLSDSAYYMSAIGEYFHGVLGYDVYIPLLQGHGLKSTQGMAGVTLAHWLENVGYAINCATLGATRVSIGGLSMGGSLGYFMACIDPRITGDLYLFSAALGLPEGPCGIPGWFKEVLLCLPFIGKFGSTPPLVGKHPFRYDRIYLNSAAQLVQLIRKINHLPLQFIDTGSPDRRIFSAWSECDKVISLDKLRHLQWRSPEGRFVTYVIPASDQVEHACVVLQDPIYAPGAESGAAPLEPANPRFGEMLAAVARFAVAC